MPSRTDLESPRWYSGMLSKEDYWAIWLGLLILAVAVGAFWLDSPSPRALGVAS